jgi:hypothetical protein
MVRSILALLDSGMLDTFEALEQLMALGIAPRVAGILLRQASSKFVDRGQAG